MQIKGEMKKGMRKVVKQKTKKFNEESALKEKSESKEKEVK